MNFFSTMILALAMSADAFAAAVGKGTALYKPRISEALRTGLIFGVIETVTPLIGWAIGSLAADIVEDWDHWIAFTVLLLLGLVMIRNGFKNDGDDDDVAPTTRQRHSFWLLAATGFATSIDAMAVGVSLAFIDNNILVTAIAIGVATLVMVTTGVMIGRLIGSVVGRRAEVLGGVALIGVGSLILYEHLTM